MRTRAWLIIIGACGAALGCGQARDAGEASPAAAGSAASAASAASEAPATVASAAPRPDTSLDGLLQAAEGCVKDGRVRRSCAAFARLRTALQGMGDDPAGWGAMLVKAKGDPALPVTTLALTLLEDGAIQGPAADFVPAVKPLLDSASPQVRAIALRALSGHPDPALAERALTLLAEDTASEVREVAAYLLGRPLHHGVRARSEPLLLTTLVNDDDPAVRRAVIGALGKLRPKAAVKPLISLLDHPQVGPNAAVQLGGFDDPEAFRAILSRIAQVKDGTVVSPSLFAALGRMRQAKAFDAAAAKALLTDVRPALVKIGHPNGQVGLQMLDRLLQQLGEGPAKATP